MAMNKIPTLVVGVGGIGCRIAAQVSDMLSEEDRQYVGLVGMDTNVLDLEKLKKHNMRVVRTSDDRTVREFLQNNESYSKWFPVSHYLLDRGFREGAGQIRAISRMAAIAAEERGDFQEIDKEIQRIRQNNSSLAVMIVGSITGGTGAGIFLQVPLYIRQLMKHTVGLDSVIIRGMFVGADITEGAQPSDINKRAMHVNAYSCLKELNAFYIAQNDRSVEDRLELDWYERRGKENDEVRSDSLHTARVIDPYADPEENQTEINLEDAALIREGKANIPYNYLYLIENSFNDGTIGLPALESVEKLVANMVFTYMFTPVHDNAASVVDNFVLQDMEQGGMGRYASTGLCKLVYPKKNVENYVTYNTVSGIIKEDWLLIDDFYDAEKANAIQQQKTDRDVKIPELKDVYPEQYKKLIGRGQALAGLYSEAYADEGYQKSLNTFVTDLEKEINTVLSAVDLDNKKKACDVQFSRMEELDEAKIETTRVYNALRSYQNAAEDQVGKAYSIVNSMIPSTLKLLESGSKEDKSLYRILADKHPLTARYFCYQIINDLEKKIEANKKNANIDLNVENLAEADFSAKEEGIQTADRAVGALESKSGLRYLLDEIGVNVDRRKLHKIAKQLATLSGSQTANIERYLSVNLRIRTYEETVRRLNQIVKNYEVFFSSIHNMIKNNTSKMRDIERRAATDSLGEIRVCFDSACLEVLCDEYMQDADRELPADTKLSIFRSLYKVFEKDMSLVGKVVSEKQQERHDKEKKEELSRVFKVAVADNIRKSVRTKEEAALNMNIIEALQKEMTIRGASAADREEDEDSSVTEERREELRRERYIRDRINEALKGAAPLVASERKSEKENAELAFVAMNPECAMKDDDDRPDAGLTKDAYAPEGNRETTHNVNPSVILDEEFSRYEITCLRAQYKLLITDLTKYKRGSVNEQNYNERLSQIGKKPSIVDVDAFKTVINPHLNRYWNEEGFIPAIDPVDRRDDLDDRRKAFIYALGMDQVVRLREKAEGSRKNVLRWYANTAGSLVLINSCGQPIGNSFTDLYEALAFNGRLKKGFLNYARFTATQKKASSDAQTLFDNILQDDFVLDLSQVPTGPAYSEEKNIIDIFAEMMSTMDEDDFNGLFTGLLLVIWEYCNRLFDGNVDNVDAATRKVLRKIYNNSSIGAAGKDESKLDVAGQKIKAQYDRITNIRYRGR